jgi:hypothetical protein
MIAPEGLTLHDMSVDVFTKRELNIHSILSRHALCLSFLVVCHGCKNVVCVWRGCKLQIVKIRLYMSE